MGTCARVMLAARVAMRSVSAGWAHMHILVMLVARVVMVIRHAVCPGARGTGALWSGGATLARSWRRRLVCGALGSEMEVEPWRVAGGGG